MRERSTVKTAVLILGASLMLAIPAAEARAEPEARTTIEDDGTIVAEITVTSPESAVRRLLSDPKVSNRFSPDVLGVEVAPQGECQAVTTRTRGMSSPMTYTTRRCPTPRGWRESLHSSDSFTRYQSEWLLQPTKSGGTRIVYRVLTELNLPVPDFLLRRETAKSLRTQLSALAKALEKR